MAEVIHTKVYIVAGTVGDRVEYLGFDSASGGYPYASAYIRDQTSDLQQAVQWLEDAEKNLPQLKNIKVYQISLHEADAVEVMRNGKVVKDLLSQLTNDQKKILQHMLK